MEGSYAQPQPPPRLRVSRQPLAAVADRPQSPEEQNAGPSRLVGVELSGSAGRDDDPEPTPKPHPNSNPVPPLEAAGRLRALLDLMPKNQSKTQARPASPSEVESDFDPPRFSPPPSEARKSLKDVFSHAIREPGDTPVKAGRNRRNSTSEVDEIPRDNAKNKGKRKSLSDEDKPNRSSLRSEASFRSSQAATFDILRERLNNSQTPLKNEAPPAPFYDNSSADNSGDTATFFRDLNSSRATPPAATSTPAHSMEMASDSKFHTNLMEHDSEMQHLMKDLDSYEDDSARSRPVSFPASRGKQTPRPGSSHAHNSTSQSHRLSYNGNASRPVSQLSHLHAHGSHHDAPDYLKELEVGWNKPHPKDHEKQHPHGARSRSPMPGMNGHSHARTHSSDSGHSMDVHHDPRPVSRISSHSGTDSHHDEPVHLKELEGRWNKPHPKGPPRPQSHSPDHAHTHSPVVGMDGHSRVRTQSGGSIRSVEGNLSSRGTSASSHSDYKERLLEQEKEHNAEREHMWNRPQAARSTSTRPPVERTRKLSDVHSPVERSRKLSQPLRPGSSQSLLAPAITRRSSSSASSSRASSDEEEQEILHEIEHERERNWNAPIPKWHEHPPPGHHVHHAGPKLSTPSSSISTPGDRVRAQSLKSPGTPKGDSPILRTESARPIASSSKTSTGETPPQARPKSLLGSSSRPRPVSYPARPSSPLPPPRPHSPLPPARPRSPLPPTRPHDSKSKPRPVLSTSQSTHKPTSQPRSPERGHSRMPSSPSPSPAHRPANRTSMSHIPVRTMGKTQGAASNGHSEVATPPQQTQTNSFQQAAQVPELSEPESDERGQNGDFLTETGEGDDHSEVRTPTVETIVLPPTEQSRLPNPPSPPPVVASDEEAHRRVLADVPPSPPPSPPSPSPSPRKPIIVTPSEPEPTPTLTTILDSITTPTKRPTFTSSRLEFHTPPPPHGLPDLPDPPSPSDEETETEGPVATPLRFNGASDTFTKTPRPPGAWASTPAPVARTNFLPTEPEKSDCEPQNDSGLATPVPSLSRALSLPAQTPKPPGGWVATPTPRKSILKVRFDPQQTELELSATEDFSSTNGHPEEACQASETGSMLVEEDRVHTPELPRTPLSPSRSPTRSPRRSPSIRVVDAFGRPESKLAKTPKNRNKNPVRIVDAMGREVETPEQTIKAEVPDDVPMNHNEALRVVREGVAALAQKLDEFDTSNDFVLSDEDRLRDLDNASRAARAAREDLKQTYETDRTTQLRASMRRSKSNSQMLAVDSRSPSPRIWVWTFIILSQALFIFLIYQLQKRSAKELFLTTYYDPFYPDLHLYGIKYDYLTFRRTSPTMTSLSNTWRQEGFRAFWAHLVDMLVLLFADWRADTWRRWGGDNVQQSIQWPPT
ncbi:hypothetical protein B0H12DRAFT_1118928 [Mycena haematopus]|nr:hypothetical protein B0H12DRAFT_1118928 [Mycena haematopus]